MRFSILCIISCISGYYIINTFILTEKETLIVKTKRNVFLIRQDILHRGVIFRNGKRNVVGRQIYPFQI